MQQRLHWLDYDAVAFAVLAVGMGMIALLALSWPPDESEIPDENEIPERRRRSPALLLFGWTCARDGLAHAAGLTLSLSHRLDCGSSARRINRH